MRGAARAACERVRELCIRGPVSSFGPAGVEKGKFDRAGSGSGLELPDEAVDPVCRCGRVTDECDDPERPKVQP